MWNGKCIAKKANPKGEVFALCSMTRGGFSVLKLCENHDHNVRGGIRKTWRYVVSAATEMEARTVFDRRCGA